MIETLEPRELFSVPTVSLSAKGTLTITGTSKADSLTLQLVHDTPAKGFVGSITGGSPKTTVNIREKFTKVKRISIDLGGGNDSAFIGSGLKMTRPTTILGGAGDDSINYSAFAPMLIVGGSGNDVLGRDAIVNPTSSRNSAIIKTLFDSSNSTGACTLVGGAGNDTLSGDTNDQVDGGSGTDSGVIVVAATDTDFPADRRNGLAELYYARLGAVSIENTTGFSLLSNA